MLAPDSTISEFTLPAVDLRALPRRLVLPALLAGATVAVVLLAGGRVSALADGLRRGLGVSPGWAAAGGAFEFISLAGYMGLLSLVAGRATPRVGARESAQITLAGAAATRLLPTAGAGGLAVTLWALRRAGLEPRKAARTLLVFLVALYSVFLLSIVLAGTVLALGIVGSSGPVALSAFPALGATLGVALCLLLASTRGGEPEIDDGLDGSPGDRRSRLAAATRLIGDAVRDACRLLRCGDPRLAGAIAYWVFDAAVVWAMLHAFGSAPVVPVVALAYFVGQVANTLPIPGSVSAGMTGVLIAFGVPAEQAIPSVLAYRAVAVWLPSPVAIAAVPALRATVARWGREDETPSAVTPVGDGPPVEAPAHKPRDLGWAFGLLGVHGVSPDEPLRRYGAIWPCLPEPGMLDRAASGSPRRGGVSTPAPALHRA
ncbi:MAG TPA: lysylphosphatidylglycerol synthase transmembrane domain-containing protein [Solirubrobacteraceae bacterium]|nr:lysylphosphatidylglycerol synthase transmembrane domain-containing protein [Solirubrobacteraceae bacterium]